MKLFLLPLFAVAVRAQFEGMSAASAFGGVSDFSSVPGCGSALSGISPKDLSLGDGMCGGLNCEWSEACMCQSFPNVPGVDPVPIDVSKECKDNLDKRKEEKSAEKKSEEKKPDEKKPDENKLDEKKSGKDKSGEKSAEEKVEKSIGKSKSKSSSKSGEENNDRKGRDYHRDCCQLAQQSGCNSQFMCMFCQSTCMTKGCKRWNWQNFEPEMDLSGCNAGASPAEGTPANDAPGEGVGKGRKITIRLPRN